MEIGAAPVRPGFGDKMDTYGQPLSDPAPPNRSAEPGSDFRRETPRPPERGATGAESQPPRAHDGADAARLTRATRALLAQFAGGASKNALALGWMPFSTAVFFGTLILGGQAYPNGYDWRMCVMSNLTSPRQNPAGCWLPALGIMTAMVLALPFAGYVAHRLRVCTPRLAWASGLTFAAGFILLWLAVAAQFAEPYIGLRSLHQLLAGAAGGLFVVGMGCCCARALRDRLRYYGGRNALPGALVAYWLSLTLLPAGCLIALGLLVLLGRSAGVVWAEDFRQSFRHTVFWQLAFWEWIGAVVAFAFLTGSALLLPAASGAERK